MKNLILLVLGGIMMIAGSMCLFWAAVEFVLYLAKDDPFNWISIASAAVSYILGFILYIFGITEQA